MVRDWGDELSLGEQQRLAFARVLVNRPKLAILDEATSALDLTNEAVMYEAMPASRYHLPLLATGRRCCASTRNGSNSLGWSTRLPLLWRRLTRRRHREPRGELGAVS